MISLHSYNTTMLHKFRHMEGGPLSMNFAAQYSDLMPKNLAYSVNFQYKTNCQLNYFHLFTP